MRIDLQGVPCKPYRVWVCSVPNESYFNQTIELIFQKSVNNLKKNKTNYVLTKQTPYLILICNIEFEELDFWTSSKWNFCGYTGN